MSTSSFFSAADRFVAAAADLCNRLDFATRVADQRPPLGKRFTAIERLWWDLQSAAASAGLDGAATFEIATAILDALFQAVEAHDGGKLEPWGRCRDRVREQLDAIRHALAPDMAGDVGEFVVRSAPPAPTPRPPAISRDAQGGEKGEKGEKTPALPQGRPRKPAGATRADEAAWWRDRAHLNPQIADHCEDDRLDQLYGRMVDNEFEVHLRELGAEDLPGWWPHGPNRRPVETVRFAERMKSVSSATWAKYVQRFDNAQNRPVPPRHHQDNVEPQESPKPTVKIPAADAAILAFEDALENASDLLLARDTDGILDKIRRIMSRIGIVGDDADELLDLEPSAMVAELDRRRRAVEESLAGTKSRR